MSRHSKQSDRLTRRENNDKIYVKNIRKIHVGSERGSGSALFFESWIRIRLKVKSQNSKALEAQNGAVECRGRSQFPSLRIGAGYGS